MLHFPFSIGARLVWPAIGLLFASAAVWAATASFEFQAFGSFKKMKHTGDTSGQLKLAELPKAPGSWGMGALAGLKGEVLLYDGRVLVSRGDDVLGKTSAPQPDDEALLFAASRVQEWVEVMLPVDMSQVQFEAFLLDQAKVLGLNVDKPFPFLMQGLYPALTWHVLTGQTLAAGAQHGSPSSKRVFERASTMGRLVGIYSGPTLEGVVTHPGQRFHVHFVDDTLSVSGHVDVYAVAKGSLLKLPVR